uniref:Golgin subfamily A member 1 n=1 Tax=Tetraodon nigroviridis TaxID=99883 RepID=H3CBB2_TETNG
MFAKLKKKIAEEAATAPRSSVRIPRTISKESITSMGADSGDDFASDGSSSRDDLPAQLLRRNDQIRRLEAKLSDYAEQLRVMQRTKDKLELALEKHQDSSIKKLQEQNESHQVNRTRMAESMAVALEKKDQEWMEKMAVVEKEKTALSAQIEEMMDQSLALFQKRDDLDELEGFQQQELAKVKHMLLKKEEQLSQQEHQLQQKEAALHSAKRNLSEVQGSLQVLKQRHEESSRLNAELEIEREELLLLKEESDSKVRSLERQCGDLQSAIQQLSEDFHKADVVVEEKERVLAELQKKAVSLERRLQGNLSQDEHLQELLQEKSSLEESLEESRAELLALRTNHADSVGSLEAQIADLEQQLLDTGKVLKKSEQQGADKQQLLDKLVTRERFNSLQEWGAEKIHMEQQSQEKVAQLQQSLALLEAERRALRDAVVSSAQGFAKPCWPGADLEQQKMEADSARRHQSQELQQIREELEKQQAKNEELSKVLEELAHRKEVESQVEDLSRALQVSQQEVSAAAEKLAVREESIRTLHSGSVTLLLLRSSQGGRALRVGAAPALPEALSSVFSSGQVSYLEVEVETLTEQLQSPEVCVDAENGSVTVNDLDHIQKVNRELEQQLGDKNRTIKQLQQRLAELKRTLQKELKLKPDPDPEDRQEKACLDPPPASSPPTSTIMVTNSVDLNDSREINFEYLKHVVLKFMSSREAEAFQLIRAVSVLLNFTPEEEDMLKQTLEYKMSWFGSRPSPKGIIRPSVSGAFTHWS